MASSELPPSGKSVRGRDTHTANLGTTAYERDLAEWSNLPFWRRWAIFPWRTPPPPKDVPGYSPVRHATSPDQQTCKGALPMSTDGPAPSDVKSTRETATPPPPKVVPGYGLVRHALSPDQQTCKGTLPMSTDGPAPSDVASTPETARHEVVSATKTTEVATGSLAAKLRYADGCLAQRNLDEAIAVYTEIISATRDFTAYNNRGMARYLKKDYAGAIADYTESLEHHPHAAQIHITLNARGVSHRDSGDLDAAIADFDQAIELQPEYANAYFNKAAACMKAFRLPEAHRAYKKFVEVAPAQYAAIPQYAAMLRDARKFAADLAKFDTNAND